MPFFRQFRHALTSLCLLAGVAAPAVLLAAIVPVGAGSYTTTFPGTDSAGRNGVPSGTPQLSGPAVGQPIPTNDWWSGLLNRDHVNNLFNYPLAMRTLPAGLDVGLIIPTSTPNGATQPLSDVSSVIVGVSGLNAPRATVDDYGDWTVTIAWANGSHRFLATTGLAMPFVHFEKGSADVARVQVNLGNATIDGATLIINQSQSGARFALYAPVGSTWQQSGNVYTSTLNGRNHWSLAILPGSGAAAAEAAAWRPHAFAFPAETRVDWAYDTDTANLRATYSTTIEDRSGNGSSPTSLQGLLPHQWAHLAPDAPARTGVVMPSIRGPLHLLAANSFATERTFHGILPTLPAVGVHSSSFDPGALSAKIQAIQSDGLATWTDSYNEGQVMNRLIQTGRIAHETGDADALTTILATVRERLEDWLTAKPGEVAFLFHYSPTWTALIGYPAGHGQDSNLNDHHFHWGYFIHAAAFVEQFSPGWADDWGPMIDLLIRDAASPQRDDPLFPFLRSFSPFAGHSWANGFATFPFGNDQESSSESMQFNSALIHWGSLTGNDAIRDLGIYLYTTEQAAIEEYWFDQNNRTFKPTYGYSVASRIWGNGYDNQTFWTSDIAAAYGIELYPMHTGSFYLAHNLEFAEHLWDEITQNTGILAQAVNVNLWHDVYWQFLALFDAPAAIALYNGNPGRELKFGISDAQTYHWLHAMNALGHVDATMTADDPLAVVFRRLDGTPTYVAHNYQNTERVVRFSDGFNLTVPARSLATSLDLPLAATLTSPFTTAPISGRTPLALELEGTVENLQRVEWFQGATFLGSTTVAPHGFLTPPLSAGQHSFSARLVTSEGIGLSNLVTVTVGEGFPYHGSPTTLPGTLEPGHYDAFEGGRGQGITYHDTSPANEGDFRPEEAVDVALSGSEGATVGWISGGEWLYHTVAIAADARYRLDFRYASGNSAGGGPFFLELDGRRITPDISVPATGGWDTWATATVADVPLRAGTRQLRLVFTHGEFNLGRLTFTQTGALPTPPPRANAGPFQDLSATTVQTQLDGSGSFAANGTALTYLWEQVYGPAVVRLDDPTLAQPVVSDLFTTGRYGFRLTVSDGETTDHATVDLRKRSPVPLAPTISFLAPAADSVLPSGEPIRLSVTANDADGHIERVDFYNHGRFLGSVTEAPYVLHWWAPEGTHSLVARATDDSGLTAETLPRSITIDAPPPCTGEASSGDFAYVFGTQNGKPTITFVPRVTGVGQTLCLLYYGASHPLPGHQVTPNVPYPLNANAGDTIRFYFTYSHPAGGERNSLAENASFQLGACDDGTTIDPAVLFAAWQTETFDAADLANPALEATLWGESADPDGDGLSNWLEFAFGGDALTPDHTPLMWTGGAIPGAARFRTFFHSDLPLESLRLEASADLLLWTPVEAEVLRISQAPDFSEIEWELPAGHTAPFLRLHLQP